MQAQKRAADMVGPVQGRMAPGGGRLGGLESPGSQEALGREERDCS